jgi:hypothetical protein
MLDRLAPDGIRQAILHQPTGKLNTVHVTDRDNAVVAIPTDLRMRDDTIVDKLLR